jgi:hypothetical protein
MRFLIALANLLKCEESIMLPGKKLRCTERRNYDAGNIVLTSIMTHAQNFSGHVPS